MRIGRIATLSMSLLLLVTTAAPLMAQDSVRVMTYNLLRYGAQGIGCTPTGVTTRNPWLSGILNLARPDIFGVNEMGPYTGPTSPSNNMLVNILQPINPAYRATTITYNGSQDVTNMMYYNSDKVGLAWQAVIPEPTLTLRDINFYQFYYKGPGLAQGDTTFIGVVQVHLHSSDEPTRIVQTQDIMNYLDGLGYEGNFIVQGDFNLDGSTAQSFQNMVAHTNPDCKMNDVLGLTGNWHNNANAHPAMTQAPDPNPSNPCGSGGALDDRFDHILVSNAIKNNTFGLRYLPGSYWVLGNPYAPNPSVGTQVLGYIKLASDHHPLLLDLEVSRAVSAGEAQAAQAILRVQPNPVMGGELRVRINAQELQSERFGLELIGLDGQVKRAWNGLSIQNSDLHLDVSGLAMGAYFLRLSSDSGISAAAKVLIAR
ncbi:MAG: hypothetical protein U0176_13445 [Bacteroidia bacterium]